MNKRINETMGQCKNNAFTDTVRWQRQGNWKEQMCMLTKRFSSVQLHHTDCMNHHLQVHSYPHWLPSITHLKPWSSIVVALLTSVEPRYQQSGALPSGPCVHEDHNVMYLRHWHASVDPSSTLMQCYWHQPTNSILNQSSYSTNHCRWQLTFPQGITSHTSNWTWSSVLNGFCFGSFCYFSVMVPCSTLNWLPVDFSTH